MDQYILENILSFLPPTEVVKCESVCKEWKDIARKKSVWKSQLNKWQSNDEYMECNNFDIFHIIENTINDVYSKSFPEDEESRNIERFLTLVLTRPKVLSNDTFGVHISAEKGNLLAYIICSQFEDRISTDEFGRTPMECAEEYGQYDIAEYIFDTSCDDTSCYDSYDAY